MGNFKKTVKKKTTRARARARLATKKVRKTKRNIDDRLIDLATKSMDQLKHKIEAKTHLDIDKDLAKQLGKVVLEKAQEIKKTLVTDSLSKVRKKTKKKKTKTTKKKASKKTTKKKSK